MERELGVSTIYVARSAVQHVDKDPAYFLVYMESCVGAFGPNGGGGAMLFGGRPKVPLERTVSSKTQL